LAVAASLPEKFASGAARFDAQGLIVDGQMVPPPDWLTFTPDSGTTRSAITVSVAPTASVFGVYHAVIIAVAQDETLADRVKFTTVNAVLANQFYYLPLTMKP
jgi:hypothetical protein